MMTGNFAVNIAPSSHFQL